MFHHYQLMVFVPKVRDLGLFPEYFETLVVSCSQSHWEALFPIFQDSPLVAEVFRNQISLFAPDKRI